MIKTDPSRELVGYLVRHGELNVKTKWDGWGAFVLSDEGRQSAEKAADWLSFIRIGRVIASDLPRTIQTAEILMQSVNVSCPYLGSDPNLRAWAIGEFSGKEKTPERKERFQFYRDHPDIPIPGGESFDQMKERVKVIYQYLATPYNALPTVLVIHNSVLKALMDVDEKGDMVDPGGIVAVYMTPTGDFEFDAVLGAAKLTGEEESSCG